MQFFSRSARWSFALVFALSSCGGGTLNGGPGGDGDGDGDGDNSGGEGGSGDGDAAGGESSTSGGSSSGDGDAVGGSTGGAGTGGVGTGSVPGVGGDEMGGFGGDDPGPNDPPSVFLIADIGTPPGTPFPSFAVHFYDDHSNSASIQLAVESSDEVFLPLSGITWGDVYDEGSPDIGHFYRDLTLTPTTLTAGESTVTITVQDEHGASSSRSFTASVSAVLVNGAEAVSVSSGESPTLGSALSFSGRPSLSADGNLVAFESNADFGAGASAGMDIYLRDRDTLITTRITPGLGTSERPTTTPDGRYIAFYSTYPLVGTDTNGVSDCYIYDTELATFEQVSVTDDESQANAESRPTMFANSRPALSDDGRYVAFISSATNLVASDTNGKVDVFVRDRTMSTTTRVSVSTTSVQADQDSDQPTMSGDGSIIAFSSAAQTLQDGVTDTDNRVDVFVRQGGSTTRISSANGTMDAANGASDSPSLSGDGSTLAFSSAATNLGSAADLFGHTDIWLYTFDGSTFVRVNVDLGTAGSQGYCAGPSLNEDGTLLVFTSMGFLDETPSDDPLTYTYDLILEELRLASANAVGSAPNGGTGYNSVISGDGTTVAFQTAASDIVYGDTNSGSDVFVVPF